VIRAAKRHKQTEKVKLTMKDVGGEWFTFMETKEKHSPAAGSPEATLAEEKTKAVRRKRQFREKKQGRLPKSEDVAKAICFYIRARDS